MLRLILLFLGLLATSTQVAAGQWREVGEVPERDAVVLVDDASITVDHDTIVKGWVRFDYDKPHTLDGHKLVSYVSQRMVNCETNRYWLMDGYGTTSGTAEQVRLYSSFQEWQMPPPDSEAEVASAALCNEAKSVFSSLWGTLQIANRLQLVWKLIRSAILL
jgi:hypothetical protein